MSLARPLADLMQEANQVVPAWLTRCASRVSHGGGKNRRSGGARFGGRDFRREGSFNKGTEYYGGNSGGGYGVPAGFGGGYNPAVASAWDQCYAKAVEGLIPGLLQMMNLLDSFQ
ncbi:ATP-DEPENDENT RNA HELICASE DBP3, partial [Salix purpurea]